MKTTPAGKNLHDRRNILSEGTLSVRNEAVGKLEPRVLVCSLGSFCEDAEWCCPLTC